MTSSSSQRSVTWNLSILPMVVGDAGWGAVPVLVGNAVGGYGLAQRAYLVLCALWLLFAAIAVLRTTVGERRGLARGAAV